MTDLMPILVPQVDGEMKPITGECGTLEFVEIDNLRVDLDYQRQMSGASIKNIGFIARNFDWRQFGPVIGVRLEDGTVAVVDGQHRSSAALIRGITKVPVYVVNMSRAEAAGAFAAINGRVTPMTPQDIYRARLMAGDPEAVELQKCLDVAGVKIVVSKTHGKGESRSVNPLQNALRTYGRELLILSLQCITETGDGNAGLITGAVVNGIARSLLRKTELLNEPTKILEFFDKVPLRKIVRDAEGEYQRTKNPVANSVARELNARIHAKLMK